MEGRVLATGGFGTITRGKYLSQCIVKKEMIDMREKEFLDEVITTHCYRSIRSPTIMGILEDFDSNLDKENNHKASFLLEMIKGENLRQKISKLTFDMIQEPKNELYYLLMLTELAKAVQFLHRKNLIHRDLKPENILISENFDLKLIDFGISKQLSKECSNVLTVEKGTIYYEPPENICDTDINEDDMCKTDFNVKRNISKAFDIWSFGLIVSEIFGCEFPYGEELRKTPYKILINHMEGRGFPIPDRIKDSNLLILIKDCTEKNPKNRISIEDIITSLTSLLKDRLVFYSKKLDISKLFDNKESKY